MESKKNYILVQWTEEGAAAPIGQHLVRRGVLRNLVGIHRSLGPKTIMDPQAGLRRRVWVHEARKLIGDAMAD